MSTLGPTRSASAVTISLTGGLGNQLFGYALGRQLAESNNCMLRLEMSSLGRRQFELNGMGLPGHVTLLGSGSRPRDHGLQILGRIRVQRRVVQERSYAFDPSLLRLRPPVSLHGYFQSWRYFPDVADDLRDEIRQIQAPSDEFVRLKNELPARFVALHVRRGDYLASTAYHGVAASRYFVEGREFAGASDLPTVIFTDDDAGWVPNWPFARSSRILRPSDLPDARETLILLSRAHGLVLSNSSFAWWAAWLEDTPGRRVVAPRPWFAKRKMDTRDLLPLSWLTLDLRDR